MRPCLKGKGALIFFHLVPKPLSDNLQKIKNVGLSAVAGGQPKAQLKEAVGA